MLLTVWCAGLTATRLRVAVSRTRIAASIPRPRFRLSALVSPSGVKSKKRKA